MRTVLIAQRDGAFAERLAAELRHASHGATICPGPLRRTARCTQCSPGYCPLTEDAGVVIWDPGLRAFAADGESHILAVESALAHPQVKILLTWSQASVPDVGTLRSIRAQVPWVHVAAHEPAALPGQIQSSAHRCVRSGEVIP